MYSKFAGIQESKNLRKYHHITLDQEFKQDCRMWLKFLQNSTENNIARPYTDIIEGDLSENILNFTSDASANESLGYGTFYNGKWIFEKWNPGFIRTYNPSIEFLELYAFCVGVFTWIEEITEEAKTSFNKVYLYCDNDPVVKMLNHTSSSCKYCMTLIRKLTLKCIHYNVRILGKHIKSEDNFLSDNLSRLKIGKFKRLASKHEIKIDKNPTDAMKSSLWPSSEYWKLNCLDLN